MNADPGAPIEPSVRLLTDVRVRSFRTLRDVSFQPGPISALVGEAGTGKSNLLAAIRAALDPLSAPVTHRDATTGENTSVRIEVATGAGGSFALEGHEPSTFRSDHGDMPLVLYLPARLRATTIIDAGSRQPLEVARSRTDTQPSPEGDSPTDELRAGTTEAAHDLVAAVKDWGERGMTGAVVLIEEPESFLPPQTQRYLYRLLRRLADQGNQIFYSTHSAAFLNVARLHELVLTDRHPTEGTRLLQPESLPKDEEFRAFSEFDATRSELFLSRAAILVEGQTERLALPFVFHALGFDPDAERISIIECGGKPNIPVIAQVADRVGIPYLAVHDRDARQGDMPSDSEQRLNDLIGQIAGDHRVELTPDFEGVTGLKGHSHKPARAWRRFAGLEPADMPTPLVNLVQEAVRLARQ